MTVYKKPILGKYGIRSHVSNNLVFGICCDTALECWEQLEKHMEYWDTQKYRWFISQWCEKDIEEQKDFIKKKKKEKREKQKEREIKEIKMKEYLTFMHNNIDKLKEEYAQKIKFYNKINYFSLLAIEYYKLKEWLKIPERLNEVENDSKQI